MINVTIDGHDFRIRDEVFNKYSFMRKVSEVQKNPVLIYDVMDAFVVGGADEIAKAIDPVSMDPSNDEMAEFITRIFEAAGETLKNSAGSQA